MIFHDCDIITHTKPPQQFPISIVGDISYAQYASTTIASVISNPPRGIIPEL